MESFQADKLQRLASRVQFNEFRRFPFNIKQRICDNKEIITEIAQKSERYKQKLTSMKEKVTLPHRCSKKIKNKIKNINIKQNMKMNNFQAEDKPEFCVDNGSSGFESNTNFNSNGHGDLDGAKCEEFMSASENNEIADRKYYYGDLCNLINHCVESSFDESHLDQGNVLPNPLNEQDASIEYEDSTDLQYNSAVEINKSIINPETKNEISFDNSHFDQSYVHKDTFEDRIALVDENVLRNSFQLVDVKGTNPLYWDLCCHGTPSNNNNTGSRFRIASKSIDDGTADDGDDDYDDDEDESCYHPNSSTPTSPSYSTNTRSTEIQSSESYFTDHSSKSYYKPVKHARFKPASNETGTQTVVHKAVDANPRLLFIDEKAREGKGVIVPKTKKRRKDKNTLTNRLSGKPRNASLEDIPSSDDSDSNPDNDDADQKQILIRWGNVSAMIPSERIKKEHAEDKKDRGVMTENQGVVTSFSATSGSYDLVSSASYDVVPTNFAGRIINEEVLSENVIEKTVLLERKCSSDYIDMDFEEEVKTKSSKGCHDLMREFNRHAHNKAFASFNLRDSLQSCYSEQNAVNSNNHSCNITGRGGHCNNKNGFYDDAVCHSDSDASNLSGPPRNFRRTKHSGCQQIKVKNNSSSQQNNLINNFDFGDNGNIQVACCCDQNLIGASNCHSNCVVQSREYNQFKFANGSQLNNYRLSNCDQEMDECDICKSVRYVEPKEGGSYDHVNNFKRQINSSNSCYHDNSDLFCENNNNNNDSTNTSIKNMFSGYHNEDCGQQNVRSLMCPRNIRRLSELLKRLQESLSISDFNKNCSQNVSPNDSSEDYFCKRLQSIGREESLDTLNNKSEFLDLLLRKSSSLDNFQSQETTELPSSNQNEGFTNRIKTPINQLEERSDVRNESQDCSIKNSKPLLNQDRNSQINDKYKKMRNRIKTGYETDISESDFSGCDIDRHHHKNNRKRFFKSRSRRSKQTKARPCGLSSSESSNSEERNKALFGKKILKCRSEMKYKEIDDNNNNASRRYYSPAHRYEKFLKNEIKWPKSCKDKRNSYPMNVTNYPDEHDKHSMKRRLKERDAIRKFLISELERLRESLEKERRTFLGELSATRQQIKDYEQNQKHKMEQLENLVCQRLECYDRVVNNQNMCPYSPCPYNEPVVMVPNDMRSYYDPNFAMAHLKPPQILNNQMNVKPLAISNFHPNNIEHLNRLSTLRYNECVPNDFQTESVQNYHIKSRDLHQLKSQDGRFIPPTLAFKNEKTLKKENAEYSRRRHSVNGSSRDMLDLREHLGGTWMNPNKAYEGSLFNRRPRYESEFAPHQVANEGKFSDLPVKSQKLHDFAKNSKAQVVGKKNENKVYHPAATQYPKQTRSNQVTPNTNHSTNQAVQQTCNNKTIQRNISPLGVPCDRSFLSSEVEKVLRSSLTLDKQEPYKTMLASKMTSIARSPAVNMAHFNQDFTTKLTANDFKKNDSKNNNICNSRNHMCDDFVSKYSSGDDMKCEINENCKQDSKFGASSMHESRCSSLSRPTTNQKLPLKLLESTKTLDLDLPKSNQTNQSNQTSQRFKSAESFKESAEGACTGIGNGSINTFFSRWSVM